MNKRQLRTAYRAKRQELTCDQYLAFNNKIQTHFFDNFGPFTGKTVHSFLPVKRSNEADTWPIISGLREAGATVTIPKAHIELLQLTSHIYKNDTALEENEWGVPEPTGKVKVQAEVIDIIILPLLAFDKRGYRVGYGKGFYDRFLTQCRSEVLKIGLSFFHPVAEISDVDEFDVKMDYCITPDKIYRFWPEEVKN